MGMLDSFLHPERGYEEAEKGLNKYYNESKGYQLPFMQHGLDQYGNLMSAENQLLNPVELENKWANSYEMSPYTKNLLEKNLGQGRDEASAQGLLGSSAAINNIQQGAGRITAEDRRNYLQDLMQKYLHGIGIGQNIYGTGASAGAGLASNAMNQGKNIAELEYGKQMAPGSLFENLLSAGGKLLSNIPGVGQLFNSFNNYNPGMQR